MENLLKIKDLSTETRNKIVEILDVILYKFELFFATEKDAQKIEYIEMPFFYKEYEHISLHDVKKTTVILEEHFGQLGFGFPLRGIERSKPKASWEKLYQELKNFRDVIKFKKPVMVGDKIVDLIIVKSNDDGKKYSIIVNQRFDQPVEANRAKPSWDLLFKVANDKEVIFSGEHKTSIDYFNSNNRCKLYTKTGLSITKIIHRDGGVVRPTVKMSVIAEKAYKQKINKEKKDA